MTSSCLRWWESKRWWKILRGRLRGRRFGEAYGGFEKSLSIALKVMLTFWCESCSCFRRAGLLAVPRCLEFLIVCWGVLRVLAWDVFVIAVQILAFW